MASPVSGDPSPTPRLGSALAMSAPGTPPPAPVCVNPLRTRSRNLLAPTVAHGHLHWNCLYNRLDCNHWLTFHSAAWTRFVHLCVSTTYQTVSKCRLNGQVTTFYFTKWLLFFLHNSLLHFHPCLFLQTDHHGACTADSFGGHSNTASGLTSR